MKTKKKRVLFITALCILFFASAAGIYLFFEAGRLFSFASSFSSAAIDFPNAHAAQAKFYYTTVDEITWYEITMELPDQAAAKELYTLESWVNAYDYDKELQCIPWGLKVEYFLDGGGRVTREYQKRGADEVLSAFIKAHTPYVTEKVLNNPDFT